MNTYEEPMSATEPTGANDVELQILELDDVEGHGMREVAAGLGAAAVLAGGGTAAAAAVGVHPSLPHLGSPTPSISNPIDSVDRTTDWAIGTSRDARDGALDSAATLASEATALAGHEVTTTSATASGIVAGTERTAGSVLDASGQLVRDEARTAGQAVGSTEATALQVTRGAVTTTNAVVSGASTMATSTTTDAVRKAATVLQLTTSTVNALETTIVATVETLDPQAGAGASGMGSDGWVTFSLGGENIASVQISDGQATITIKTASLGGKVLQAVYGGDSIHASSMRSLTL
jgi:hypothetical protein